MRPAARTLHALVALAATVGVALELVRAITGAGSTVWCGIAA